MSTLTNTENQIHFIRCIQSVYDAITDVNENAIYWITDKGKIYLGSILMSMTTIVDTELSESSLNPISNAAVTRELNSIKDRSISNIEDYEIQNNVPSKRLVGLDKSANQWIEQTEDSTSTIIVTGNESTIEHLRVSNKNNFPDKIGIEVEHGQRLTFYDIYIDDNYSVGMYIPKAWYDQIMSCWIQGCTGVVIGEADNKDAWNGVLDFNACHINNCDTGIILYSKDSNTICLDKCSFEGTTQAIVNNGVLYVRGTYVGDQLSDGVNDTHSTVLIAESGSKTYFDNCTLGISSYAPITSDELHNVLFRLRSDNQYGNSIVYVNGGTLGLSNNFNLQNTRSSIYDSDSKDNLIYLDFVRLKLDESSNHNRCPFRIKEFSSLRSRYPITNYVCNGTMQSRLGNELIISDSNNLTFESNLVNPFGGKILNASGQVKYFYKIPEKLVGTAMTLELYMYTPYAQDLTNPLTVSCAELSNLTWASTVTRYEDKYYPIVYRIDVIPTSSSGCITINSTHRYNVYSVILKEGQYKEYLSCYSDNDILYHDALPTATGRLNDIVYDLYSKDSRYWKFDGNSWVEFPVTYTLEGSDGVVILRCSDGTYSTVSIVPTVAIAYDLTKCSASNTSPKVAEGSGYETVLTPDANYTLSSVVVTMGGNDITSTVYDASTGKISIIAVTGVVVITAEAKYVEWTVNVDNITAAVRQSAEFTNTVDSNMAIQNANYKMIIATTDVNECSFSTRDNPARTVYFIPIPSGAVRVNVTHSDSLIVGYKFIALTYANGVYNKISESTNATDSEFKFSADVAQYLAITLNYDESGTTTVPWDYTAENTNINVSFSNT